MSMDGSAPRFRLRVSQVRASAGALVGSSARIVNGQLVLGLARPPPLSSRPGVRVRGERF